MRKWLILLSTLCVTATSAAPAWTWTDANGQVHYSDRPVPGARQIELIGAYTIGGPTAQPARSAPSGPTTQQQPGGSAPYRTIEVLSPAEQQTLSNSGGSLPVSVSFDPPLRPGHRFDLALDGQRRNLNTNNPQVTLSEVFRGTHTLQVVVIDSADLEVMRSPTRNFVIQQVSVQNPNSPLARPPAAPPPRPTPTPNRGN